MTKVTIYWQNYGKSSIWIIWFNSHNIPMKLGLWLFPSDRWGNKGFERPKNLPKGHTVGMQSSWDLNPGLTLKLSLYPHTRPPLKQWIWLAPVCLFKLYASFRPVHSTFLVKPPQTTQTSPSFPWAASCSPSYSTTRVSDASHAVPTGRPVLPCGTSCVFTEKGETVAYKHLLWVRHRARPFNYNISWKIPFSLILLFTFHILYNILI